MMVEYRVILQTECSSHIRTGYHFYMYPAGSKLFVTTFELQTFNHDVIIKTVIKCHKSCLVRNECFIALVIKMKCFELLFIILSGIFLILCNFNKPVRKKVVSLTPKDLINCSSRSKPLCSKMYNWLVFLFCLVFFYDNTKTMKVGCKNQGKTMFDGIVA